MQALHKPFKNSAKVTNSRVNISYGLKFAHALSTDAFFENNLNFKANDIFVSNLNEIYKDIEQNMIDFKEARCIKKFILEVKCSKNNFY